jgi:CheY-like chemotaxis protein
MPSARHVLLVDDHPEVRAVLAHVVRRVCPDATIVEASDGAEALSAVAGQTPDLIITDYQMPMLTGLELVRTLRAQGAAMPIVVVSSDTSITEAMLAEGANHFLPKPFPLPTLKELLRALLSKGETSQAVGE